MSKFDNSIILEAEKKTTPIELFYHYVSYTPLFIVSIALALSIAFIYLRYQQPLFSNSTTVLVKADEKSGGSIRGFGSGDLIDAAMMGSNKRVNMDNEIELLKSRSLMQRVIYKNKLNIQLFFLDRYYILHTFLLCFFICQYCPNRRILYKFSYFLNMIF